MGTRDPHVDAYIAKSPDFARPILTELREIVHAACPEVEESMKWSCPHFSFNGMLCGMAAFKQHCRLHFWRGDAVTDDSALVERLHHITDQDDLPSRAAIRRCVLRAMALNDERGAARKQERASASQRKGTTRRAVRPIPETPPALVSALRRNAAARRFFETLAPSHKRDYIEWIEEAKTEPTRDRRVATTVEWLAEGKSRNWKYETKRA